MHEIGFCGLCLASLARSESSSKNRTFGHQPSMGWKTWKGNIYSHVLSGIKGVFITNGSSGLGTEWNNKPPTDFFKALRHDETDWELFIMTAYIWLFEELLLREYFWGRWRKQTCRPIFTNFDWLGWCCWKVESLLYKMFAHPKMPLRPITCFSYIVMISLNR